MKENYNKFKFINLNLKSNPPRLKHKGFNITLI